MKHKRSAAALLAAICLLIPSAALPAQAAETKQPGDLNGDGLINASDAAAILIAAAAEGATGTNPLSAEDLALGDVNHDGICNAGDAAFLLMYAAAAGAGYEGSITDYYEVRNAPKPLYKPLTCLNEREDLIWNCPESRSMPDGNVMLTYYFDAPEGLYSYLVLVDPERDVIVNEWKMESFTSVLALTSDQIVLYDFGENALKFCNDQLAVQNTIPLEFADGMFTEDGSAYYFVADGALYCMDVAAQSFTEIPMPGGIVLKEFVIDQPLRDGLLFLETEETDQSDIPPVAAVDVTTGELKMLASETRMPFFGENDTIFATETGSVLTHMDHAGNWSACEVPGFDAVSQVGRTDYVLCQNYSDNSDSIGHFFSDGTFRTAELSFWTILADQIDDETVDLMMTDSTGITGTDKLLVTNTVVGGDHPSEDGTYIEQDVSLVYGVLDLSQLSFDETVQCVPTESLLRCDPELLAYYEKNIPAPAPSYLTPLRFFADELEEQYGVEIYLSDECGERYFSGGTTYLSTSETWPDHDEEYDNLEYALDALHTSLAKYPEGYFRQFRNSLGTGGITFAIVGTITDDVLDVAGYQYNNGSDNYIIVLDAFYNIEVNTGHELWHATEKFIEQRQPWLLAADEWMELNPEGFTYCEYEDYYDLTDEFTFMGENGDEVYFYDSYGKVNVYEDKARIMEAAMTPNELTGVFLSKPHIQAKYRRICTAVRETFDTTGWGDLVWEQYLIDE